MTLAVARTARYIRRRHESAGFASPHVWTGFVNFGKDTMKKIEAKDLSGNVVEMIGRQWMLITAGTPDAFNTMTASWGGLGYVWNRPVAYVLVRPNRYTHEFIQREGKMTLSFMGEAYRHALKICGTVSGRDHDKMAEAGLRPWFSEQGHVAIADAEVVLECRVMYADMLKEANFANGIEVEKWYGPDNPPHHLYVAEITAVWVKE